MTKTKENNYQTGLCFYEYTNDLLKALIHIFPTWIMYKVNYFGKKNEGIFITNKISELKTIERFDGKLIETAITDFRLKHDKKIINFFNLYGEGIGWDVYFTILPKGTEILYKGNKK